PLDARDREAAHLGAEERLEDVPDLLRPHDRHDELHHASLTTETSAGAGVVGSGRTRTAPSPSAYASSPCCETSSPSPSSRAVATSGEKSATSFRSASVPAALKAAAARTASAWMASCRGLPKRRPS